MSQNRSSVVVLVVAGLIAALTGILGNLATSAIPALLEPYLWLAWPLFGLLTVAGIVLAIRQSRDDPQPTKPNPIPDGSGASAPPRTAPATPPPPPPASAPSGPYDRRTLFRLMSERLTVEELDELCFHLGLKAANFPRALDAYVLALLQKLEAEGRIADLVQVLRAEKAWVLRDESNPPSLPPPDPPTPAGWNLVHPYAMSPDFTGRAAERAMLTQWLHEDRAHPVLVLRALGGFGKSALTWHWLTHDVDAARWPRVVWWSFYEADASFERFLQDTLAYLEGQPSALPPRQQADALLRHLRQPGTLLVLDGFERALRAFSGMGAAYQGDDGPPPSPPLPVSPSLSRPSSGEGGGRGVGEGRPGEGRDRDTISPIAADWLRAVATLPGLRGKVLLTTRHFPRALEARGGEPLQGCREEELTALAPADAVAFFQAKRIAGSRAELARAGERVGFHPLSLTLLAGQIVKDLQQPRDIAAARRLDVSGDLVQRQHHVLEQAYSTLTPARQTLLSRIACFRSPVSYDALRALADEGSAATFDADLHDLLERGLLQRDARANRFDLHPIVRRYAYDRLADAGRRAAHAHLRDYFAAVDVPPRVQQLEELMPVIELYHHTVRSERYQEAFTLYRDRLDKTLYYQFGAYPLCIDLLRSLYKLDGTELLEARLKGSRARVINRLALAYSHLGQTMMSVGLFQKQISLLEELGDKIKLAIVLGSFSHEVLINIGHFSLARTNLQKQVILCRENNNQFWEANGHRNLGRLMSHCGQWQEASKHFEEALLLIDDTDRQRWERGGIYAYMAQDLLLKLRLSTYSQAHAEGMHTSAKAVQLARQALDMAVERHSRNLLSVTDFVRSYWLLGASHCVNGDLDEAEQNLDEALTRCHAIRLVEYEAAILVDLARLRAAQGRSAEAKVLAEEALLITERSGYVLQGADAQLVLAHLALDSGDRAAARAHAQAARGLATCDGPPDYTYKVAYDEAGAMG